MVKKPDAKKIRIGRKTAAWTAFAILLFFMALGGACGAAAFLYGGQAGADAVSQTFDRLFLLSRAGYITAADVFWAALRRALRNAAFWSLSRAGAVLLFLGCAALALDCYAAGYLAAALVRLNGMRGALLTACIFLPQNILTLAPAMLMGVVSAAWRAPDLNEKKGALPDRTRYAASILLLFLLSLPGCALHAVMTLKLMKLLPYASYAAGLGDILCI